MYASGLSGGELSSTTTFTLTATNSYGTATTNANGSGSGPTINSFTAYPFALGEGGGEVTLNWSVLASDSTTLSIDNGVGDVTKTNPRSAPPISVTKTTTFTLTATQGTYQSTATTTVVVGNGLSNNCQGPTIYGAFYTPGYSTTPCQLTWNVGNQSNVSFDNGVGDVDAPGGRPNVVGNLVVTPCPTPYAVYTLTASNPWGTTTLKVPTGNDTVTRVFPSAGPPAGGTPVTITGSNFGLLSTVSFGGNQATGVVVNSLTSISAITPPGAAGAVDVTVDVFPTGSFTLPGGFTYSVLAPTIASIAPTSGPTAGGTPVTITGTNFEAGAVVAFGISPAAGVVVNSPTSISATTPASFSSAAGPVNVTVMTGGQTAQLPEGFTYIAPAPTIASISPTGGPPVGGTPVTILGTGFQIGASVDFGSAAATGVTVTGPGSISATTPAGTAGAVVGVTVTNPDTQSSTLPGAFTYATSAPPPTIASISPSGGPAAGGTAVSIAGSNFQSGATVTFGTASATGVTVNSASNISATTPAGAAGAVVGVTVTNPDTQSATLPGAFTYAGSIGAPTIVSFAASPNTLTASGGIVTLSWSVTGATSLSIDNGVGSVTPVTTGTTYVSIPGNSSGQPETVTFILSATNSSGTNMASAIVTVENI